ncbi:DUF2782 domain-containing protein [Nitrosomonadaceae bacterium]|nr:DUF2782 domain-containing protein [Nitrosomonadaceae bacterium]
MIWQNKSLNNIAADHLDNNWSRRESWHVFGIMAEFVEGVERLSYIKPDINIFSRVRTPANRPYYGLTEQITLQLSDTDSLASLGGGANSMEVTSKVTYSEKSTSIGLKIQLWTTIHLILLMLLLIFAAPATAQELVPLQPPDLPQLQPEPLETEDPLLEEPLVIIRKRGEDKVEEYQIDGRIQVIKVTPLIGFPYYLYDDTGDASYISDGVLDDGVRPPMWSIFTF